MARLFGNKRAQPKHFNPLLAEAGHTSTSLKPGEIHRWVIEQSKKLPASLPEDVIRAKWQAFKEAEDARCHRN